MRLPETIGDRMKRYEEVSQGFLMRRSPVIIRLDGKAFHTFTKGLDRPFDKDLSDAMAMTAFELVSEIQGAMFAYTQSDEISILLQDWETFATPCWYGYNIQKLVSVSASHATAHFNNKYKHATLSQLATFDSRVFNLPPAEVTNYFIWRQQDAMRNSVNALAQSHFPHKELHGLSIPRVHDKLATIGVEWSQLPIKFQRGLCVCSDPCADSETGRGKPVYDFTPPVFTEQRLYIEHYTHGL